MDFFKNLLGSPAKSENDAIAAVTAAKTKKDEITKKCALEHQSVDKEISDAESVLATVKQVPGVVSSTPFNVGGKKKGGKSNKKRFSKGGKRAKSQKKRR